MDGFYVAKRFESAYGHTRKAHKDVPLAFLVFTVPDGFFSGQNPAIEKGLLLSNDLEKWKQVVCYFKSGESREAFVKSYKAENEAVGNDEERRNIFENIKKEMAVKNGPETVAYIRGPFSQKNARRALASGRHQWPGDQVCIRTLAKAVELESHFSNILFVRGVDE